MFVDCANGESVSEAYWGAREYLGALHITISGVCEESIVLDRDHVTLTGATAGDGLQSGEDDEVIRIDGARGVALNNFTVVGGYIGVAVYQGASFLSSGLTVMGSSQAGIDVNRGSSGYISDCAVLSNLKYGISASGGVVEVHRCQIDQNWYGLNAGAGGILAIWDSSITNSTRHGVWAQLNGNVSISGTSIEGSASTGVVAIQNSTIHLGDGSRIADSGGDGAEVAADSYFSVDATVIENNLGAGVLVWQNSAISLFENPVIRNNLGDGITLHGLSTGDGGYAEISDNAGWGIHCAGPVAIASVQNGFLMGEIVFPGNDNGPTSCP